MSLIKDSVGLLNYSKMVTFILIHIHDRCHYLLDACQNFELVYGSVTLPNVGSTLVNHSHVLYDMRCGS